MKAELLSSENNLVHVQCSDAITITDVAGKNPLEDLLGSDYYQKSVLLHLERITYIDTSAVGWFIHCHKACKGAGRKLVLHSIPPMVDQILSLLRMNEVLHLAGDEVQARAPGTRSILMNDELGPYAVDIVNLPPEQTVHRLLEFAVELQVSDLFFMTSETHVVVAVRHLGTLHKIAILPAELGKRCMAHIKAVAGMDIAEKRRPLDGRWIQKVGDRRVDLRINSIPTLYGEDFTLRLLARIGAAQA